MTQSKHRRKRAFTLIELLVVIGVIGILMAITFGVARGVRANARRQLTNSAMINLESMLDEYISEVGKIPAIPDSDGDGQLDDGDLEDFYRYPSALLGGSDPEYVFSVSAFLRQVRGIAGVDTMLGGMAERSLVRRGEIDAYGDDGFEGSGSNDEDQARTVIDGEGYEIFYIHPSVRDTSTFTWPDELNTSKRFGIGLSGRPYFMSVGPDGKAGGHDTDLNKTYLEDNLYSAEPGGVE
jgi:prepilin-type N-terminal cleavage/methylation domain-containing protein